MSLRHALQGLVEACILACGRRAGCDANVFVTVSFNSELLYRFIGQRDQSELFNGKNYPLWLRDTNVSTGERLQEGQANYFAATLPMPRMVVEEAYAELEHDLDFDVEETLDELARSFSVSNQTLSIRLSQVFGAAG